MGFEGERDGVAINPGLGFGAEKNNPILLEMMKDIYGNRHFCREDKSIDMTPSPRLMTDFLVKKGLLVRNQRQCIGNELEIYPKSFFAPKDFWDGGLFIKADTFSIHHYDASWVDWENRVVKWLRWFLPRFGVFGKGLLFVLTYSSLYRKKDKETKGEEQWPLSQKLWQKMPSTICSIRQWY